MSQDQADVEDGNPAENAVWTVVSWVVGIVALPIIVIVFFKCIVTEFRNRMPKGLARADELHRVTCTMLEKTPEEIEHDAAHDKINQCMERGDWVGLAELVEDWDADGTYIIGSEPLSVQALKLATTHLSDGHWEANYCMPVDIPIISDTVLADISNLRATHPDHIFLACLESSMHLMRAWGYRGTDAADTVTQDGWTLAQASENKSRWAIRPFLETHTLSAMIGEIRIGWLAYEVESQAEFRRAFMAYRKADPVSGSGDSWLGYYLLPRWYGSGDFEGDLRGECECFGPEGSESYVWAYLYAHRIEAGLLTEIDGVYFAEGLRRISARFAGNQFMLNQLLGASVGILRSRDAPLWGKARKDWLWTMGQIEDAMADILRDHLQGVHPDAFEDTTVVTDMIGRAMPEEYARGDHFILDEEGLRAVPAPEAA